MPGKYDELMAFKPYLTIMTEYLRNRLKQAYIELGIPDDVQQQVMGTPPMPTLVQKYALIGKKKAFDSGVIVYGIEPDGWIRHEAAIQVDSIQPASHLVLRMESHAPVELHPITITVTFEKGNIIHTHNVAAPGQSEMRLPLPDSFAGQMTIACDHTFVPHSLNSNNPDIRELGVRIIAVHI